MNDIELAEYAKLSAKANQIGKIVYKHDNGQYELIDQLTYHTCVYKEGRWITDNIKTQEYQNTIFEQNKIIVDKLIAEATIEIEILQDKIDLDEADNKDAELLLAWKKYRIEMKKIDLRNEKIILLDKPNKITKEQL